MTDTASAARTARESLARGLSILQSPGVPQHLLDVAEPVAQAMGALHRIEASQGGAVAEQAPLALDAVRRALSQLQAAAGAHPAVDQAMEAVAGSLGTIHALTKAAPAAAPAAAPVAPAVAPVQPAAAAPQALGFGSTVALDQSPAAAAPAPQAQVPAQQPAPQQYQQPAPQQYQQPAPQQYQQPAPQQYQQPAPQQYQQPAPQQYQQPAPQQYQQPAPAAQPAYVPPGTGYGAPPAAAPPWNQQQQQQPQAPAGAWPQQPAPAAAPSAPAHAAPQDKAPPGPVPGVEVPPGTPRVEADLGAHSATNFYKGLSGNDVIECGGIFIATYKIPSIGTNLAIKVALPGGYEFEALGVVEWVREAPNSSAGVEAPPGYGAKFTQITPEGRQLVYRYVRNREPLFHDDL